MDLGTIFGGKLAPSCHQNPSKLGHSFDICFLKDVGSIFIDFLSQHNIAYIAKTLKSICFYRVFGTSASFDCSVVGMIVYRIFVKLSLTLE